MPRISFTSLMVGLFLASTLVGFGLGQVIGTWFTSFVVTLMVVQGVALALRPLIVPLHYTTESAIMRLHLYLLLFDFFVFVTVVTMHGIEPEVRMGTIAMTVVLFMVTGALVLRHLSHSNTGQFSRVRL